MESKIKNLIKEILKNLEIENENTFSIEHPEDNKNGDYSSNVAMVYAKSNKTNPKDLAEKIKIELEKNLPKEIEKVEIAGPGFINLYLSRDFFINSVKKILEDKNFGRNNIFEGKKVMVEYTQPNPFKPFHIGHLMSNTIGESISRIVEFSGAKVIRANYQGDVGPHVAKAIYQMLKNKNSTNSVMTKNISLSEKANYIGQSYKEGSDVYENDEKIKKEIDEINKKIYEKSDKEINKIYDWGRMVTLEAFEEIYKVLGTNFNYYFFESVMAPIGEKIVRENCNENKLNSIFEKSDGAIVFHAEKYDSKLHTRVFITSQGMPTYETKEIGLTLTKFEKENLDISLVTTAIEQADYMKVVQKAISLMYPELEKKMKHITHGMMRFTSGKMSSRKGNVVTGESLLYDSFKKVASIMSNSKLGDKTLKTGETNEKIDENFDKEVLGVAKKVGVAALKYSILKSSLGSDIVYDFEKSISFEGDSGPYLQYSIVRANSVLEKAKKENILPNFIINDSTTTEIEKLLYIFPEIVFRGAKEFEPHYIVNYLIELARAYNTFYGNTKIINKDNFVSSYKIALTMAFSIVIKNGLYLLGIEVPEKM